MKNAPPALSPKYKIYGALILGLSTAIAIRALIVLNHVKPAYVRRSRQFRILLLQVSDNRKTQESHTGLSTDRKDI
jgi:hypothetical protein